MLARAISNARIVGTRVTVGAIHIYTRLTDARKTGVVQGAGVTIIAGTSYRLVGATSVGLACVNGA